MAGIQLVSAGGKVFAGQEEARNPLQVTISPGGGNTYRLSAFTGTIAAAVAANAEVFQFRFVTGAKTKCLVEKVMFDGCAAITAATAAGPVGFHMTPARTWTVAGSGGTRIANTADNMQMETAAPNSQVQDIGIATTGGLTAGTKTLDANSIGQAIGGVGTGAITAFLDATFIPNQALFDEAEGGMPLVLANNEGFVIRTTHAGPAGLTYVAGFTVQWREVTDF